MPGPAGGAVAAGRVSSGRRQRLWVRTMSQPCAHICCTGPAALHRHRKQWLLCMLWCRQVALVCVLATLPTWCLLRFLTAVMGRLVSPGGHVMGVEKWPDLAQRSVNSIKVRTQHSCRVTGPIQLPWTLKWHSLVCMIWKDGRWQGGRWTLASNRTCEICT